MVSQTLAHTCGSDDRSLRLAARSIVPENIQNVSEYTTNRKEEYHGIQIATRTLVHGTIEPGFEPVQAEFMRNFTERDEPRDAQRDVICSKQRYNVPL